MQQQELLKSLDLEAGASQQEIQQAITDKQQVLQQRIESAPTDALKAKFQAQLETLLWIREILLSGSQSASSSSPLVQTNTADLLDFKQARSQKEAYVPAPPSSGKAIGIVAAVLIAIAGGYVLTQSNDELSGVLSGSEEVIPQDNMQAIQLKAEVNELAARLSDSEARGLGDESGLEQANTDLAYQQRIQDLVQQVVFESSSLTELKAQHEVGEAMVRDKKYQLAIPLLGQVKLGYQEFLSKLDLVEPVLLAQDEAYASQSQWLAYANAKSPAEIPQHEQLAEQLGQAEQQLDQGELSLSLQSYKETAEAYQQLLDDAQGLYAQYAKTIEIQKEWQSLKHKYNVILDETGATSSLNHANGQRERGELLAAQTSYQQSALAYQSLIDSPDVLQVIANAMAEAKRLVEVEAKRLAEAEAKRFAVQAEAKRLAFVEEEAKRQAELDKWAIIPDGRFQMGSDSGDRDELPVRSVDIKQFKLSKHEVTRGEFSDFIEATGYRTDAEKNSGGKEGCYVYKGGTKFGWASGASWRNPGFEQMDNEPVVCVSWYDAQEYIQWLSKKDGKRYRLPSEAGWEYAVRGGSRSKYHFGDDEKQLCRYANGADLTAKLHFPKWKTNNCNDYYVFTAPVGSFEANSFGLYDMHGNVWEWTQDCWSDSYNGAPGDGHAWEGANCEKHILRGGSWNFTPSHLRSANRNWIPATDRYFAYGFRIAQDLP